MTQEQVINKVLRDLVMAGIIERERSGEARPLLNALWTAGFEYKGALHGDRRSRAIVQCDKNLNPLQTFHNSIEAAKKLKCSRIPIRRSLLTGEPTHRGHIWIYANDRKIA